MPRNTINIPDKIEYLSILNEKGELDASLEPDIPEETHRKLHRAILLGRKFDERLLNLQRQGRIGTFAPISGQEAAQLGAVALLRPSDWMVPAFREEVPEEEETVPIGKPRIVREGKDLTMISYGAMMRPTLEAAATLKDRYGAEAEVIDLLTVSPLNDEIFVKSVLKTGRAMIIHEAPRSFGPGAEIVSRLTEKAFYYLEVPIERVTGYDVIIPQFNREKSYLPNEQRILRAARIVLNN